MIDYEAPAIERRPPSEIVTSVYKAEKAGPFGPGAAAMLYERPLEAASASPQKLALQAQRLYHDHAIVNEVERQVSGRGSSVPFHLEDENGDEITDDSAPQLVAIRDLIEKPQAALEGLGRRMTRRELWRLTLRHMGICGTAFWYFDQAEALAGTPLGILYVNPARVFAAEDDNGNLLGWTLDKPPEQRGTPIEINQLLPFYLDPPDFGHFGIGLAESIWSKAQINQLADKHEAQILAAGGRLAGMISPRTGQGIAPINDEQWAQLVRDYRGIAEDPNSARRLQIVKGSVDYTRTAATMQELAVVDISTISREDIQAHWGVPPSQTGRSGPAGLNSGTTKGYDEATLWQGAIHPRLQTLYEGIQYGLLDRFKKMGITVELKIEEPEFDDSGPAFELAQRAIFLPLTNAERRDLVGMPPLGDPAMDNAIILPNTTLLWATAPDENGNPVEDLAPPGNELNDLQAQVDTLKQQAQGVIAPPPAPPTPPPAKAAVRKPFIDLRASIDRSVTPTMRNAVAAVLAAQKADVVAKVRRHYAHIMVKANDSGVWWNAGKWNAALRDAIAPSAEQIAKRVAHGINQKMPRKAAPVAFQERVTARVLDRGAARVTGINQTTQDALSKIIADPQYDTLGALIDAIESYSGWDEARSELIARTESMDAYNAAALGSYDEFGVTEVEASDGDGDEECAARDGQTFSLDEADGIEDHPNGTLDWIPVVPDEGKATLADIPTSGGDMVPAAVFAHMNAQTAAMQAMAAAFRAVVERPTIVNNHQPAPVVNVAPTTVNLPEPIVNYTHNAGDITVASAVPDVIVNIPEPGAKRITRDRQGNVTGIEPA